MACPSCGADAPAGARFCPTCGHDLQTRSGDERRIVTVLFADIVGFTTLSEQLDPEQVKNLVDRCFESLAADITEFGGRVDKIIGDAIVALFGAPVTHEDDAERAVRAALRMQQTVAASADSGTALTMRIGVNTGEVLVGALRAGGDYTAMGDVVNTASRLQTAAAPGTVVVGGSTYLATRDVIDFEPLGPLQAKGRDEPVDTYRAVEAILPPGYRPRKMRAPFVGRDAELAILGNAVDLAMGGRAHLLLLVGEAGVGKSRLAEEVAQHAHERHEAAVFEGRCVPYGEANVWWPVAEALRQACGVSADDALDVADEAVRVAVGGSLGVAPTDAKTERTAKGLLYLLGYEGVLADVDPQRAQEEATRSVLTFVEASAARRPVVLVLSDLHWADEVVLSLIDALMDRLGRERFVVVATARHALDDRWVPRPGRHNAFVVNLDPLSADAAAQLLDALSTRELDDTLRRDLLDHSGGNPFFLEELVALVGEPETESLLPRHVELPDTLRGLVGARLDALTEPERRVVEDAAVWGRGGPVEALERMARDMHGIDGIAVVLAGLVDKDVLQIDGASWEFRSDSVRDVAYTRLTKADRARRHFGIAAYLRRKGEPDLAADQTVSVVSGHFAAAAEIVAELGTVDGVSGRVAQDAVAWLREAAQRAEHRQRFPHAARLYGRAIELSADAPPEDRLPLLLGRARAFGELRRLDDALEDAQQALHDAEAVGDARRRATALAIVGDIHQKEGRYDDAMDSLGAALDEFTNHADPKGIADTLRSMGMTQIFAGEHDAAESAIFAALDAYREIGDRRGEAWALQNLAWISFVNGNAEQAEERLSASASTFSEIGDTGGIGWALGLLAYLKYHEGHFDEAAMLAAQILDDARERGDRWGEGMMLVLLASVSLWSGRTGDAVPHAEQALATFRSIGDHLGEEQALGFLGRALVATGNVTDGLEVLRAAGGALQGDLRVGLVGLPYAAALVHLGEADEALMAIDPNGLEELDPSVIGQGDKVVTGAMALTLVGRASDAVTLLTKVVDSAGAATEVPYAQAVLALARAATGDDDVAALASAVRGATRATYLDVVTAELAVLLVAARRGDLDGVHASIERLLRRSDATGDRLTQAVVRLAAASALERLVGDDAEVTRRQAEDRLGELGIRAEGWRELFETTLAPATAGAPAEGSA